MARLGDAQETTRPKACPNPAEDEQLPAHCLHRRRRGAQRPPLGLTNPNDIHA